MVLQETPSRSVRVIRRSGDTNRIVNTSIETFGENIGVITQDVFHLDDSSTDWHETLKSISRRRTIEQIEALFDGRLGFVARSYVHGLKDDTAEE